jgi:DNA-binding NtrC family response regulator
LLKFGRGYRTRGALHLEPMEITAMRRMVFLDPDCGPSEEEVTDAARVSGGYPGVFLRSLGAATFGERAPRFSLVHESAPTYVVERRPREVRGPLLNATNRAARLARAGRHAAAIRLLNRASRVLHGRGDSARAAACAEQLAWIVRDRGRIDDAAEQFEHVKAIAPEGAFRLRAAIGLGIVWTDQQHFIEAEAALRATSAAAELLDDEDVKLRAATALARCLYCQSRYEEAALSLDPWLKAPTSDVPSSAWGLLARVRVAMGNLRGAVAAASEAMKRASQEADVRSVATAARAMAIVQAALGDHVQVRECIERGLRAAIAAHLPLIALKLRIVLVSALSEARASEEKRRLVHHVQSALARQRLPPLIRAEIESTLRGGSVAIHDRAVTELQDLLALAQTATDDRAAVEAICRLVLERLRAASVQIVTGGRDPRVLARSGRPWQNDTQLVEQVLAGRLGGMTPKSEPRQAAEPVRYGQETVAVVCCRWTAGTPVDDQQAATVLAAAALAAAAPVRGLLDQPDANASHGICAELIGACPSIVSLREAMVRAARAPFPVLIEGESGSGKELVARGIHRLSQRRDRRLCTLNCAALTDDLLEAELFGHARGAFTGAIGERPGLFEDADGGTIFLDEIGELSSRAQAKLLRVLQDGEIRRVGENMPRRVDTRIIAATNRRLIDDVAAGRFRSDLRFRLDVIKIAVPPLRERASDIPALATHFWAEATRRVGSSATLANEAVATLSRHDWPGNVRELQNVIASLAVHAPRRGRVTARLLPAHIASTSVSSTATFEAARNEFERRFVRAALAQAGGQRARAARALGISRQGLTKMMRRLRIEA